MILRPNRILKRNTKRRVIKNIRGDAKDVTVLWKKKNENSKHSSIRFTEAIVCRKYIKIL